MKVKPRNNRNKEGLWLLKRDVTGIRGAIGLSFADSRQILERSDGRDGGGGCDCRWVRCVGSRN